MGQPKKIIYIGNFDFPDGNAAGKRVHANAYLLKSLNYEVTVIDTSKISSEGLSIRENDDLGDFKHYTLPYPKSVRDWLGYKKTFNLVEELLESNYYKSSTEAVILYGSPVVSIFNFYLLNYCRKNSIKIISDVVDWLTINTNSALFNMFKRLDEYIQKVLFNSRVDGVICISSYLSDFYQRKGLSTIIIPPLNPKIKMALKDSVITSELAPVQLIYAGKPFRQDMKENDSYSLKDRIDLILNILYEIKVTGGRFKLNVFGFNREELVACMPICKSWIEELGSFIEFHGEVNNEIVVEALKYSDYSILLRDSKRDSVAGFPTKVAESIYTGTPVIVTNVGDMERYVTNGTNGFLVPQTGFAEQVKVVRTALSVDRRKIHELKINCLNSPHFTIESYVQLASSFFINIKS